MRLVLKANSRPFREMRMFVRAARKTLFPLIGTLISREAKRGARQKVGGGFGNDIANSVSYSTTGNRLTVGASHFAASHKNFGGTITAPGKGPGAKGAKALTIPLTEAARGKSARQFNNTFLLVRPGRNTIIMQSVGDGAARPLFVLVTSVTQKGTHWFPGRAKQEKIVAQAIKLWFKRRSE